MVAAAANSAGTVELAVQFVDVLDAGERFSPLDECVSTPFEGCAAVGAFPSYRGQRNWPGLWWSATLGRHVPYRSWLARDHAMELDFDLRVVGFAARPFWLHFRDGLQDRRHAPDFFARHADGTGVVIDSRAMRGSTRRTDAGCAAMALACEQAEWEYRLLGELEEPRASTLRWLAGFRHPRFGDDRRAAALDSRCEKAGGSVPLGVLLHPEDGDMTVPTVVFHQLWHQRLLVDVSVPLSEASQVSVPGAEPVR